MSKTTTPLYRIELSCVDFQLRKPVVHSFAYIVAENGTPSEANAKKYRDGMNASMSAHNSHLCNLQGMYSDAAIINQKTGEIVAAYRAPMFEVV